VVHPDDQAAVRRRLFRRVLRSQGSLSKLRTFRDGFRILLHTIRLYEEMWPLQFFTCCSAILTAAALAFGVPVIDTFARTGLVPRFPTAILALGVQIVRSSA